MQKSVHKETIQYRFLIAPLVLLAFALGWYQFSKIYIQRANDQLFMNGNFAVSVSVQQINAYMAALKEFTYATVAIALVMFFYFSVRSVQFKRKISLVKRFITRMIRRITPSRSEVG